MNYFSRAFRLHPFKEQMKPLNYIRSCRFNSIPINQPLAVSKKKEKVKETPKWCGFV